MKDYIKILDDREQEFFLNVNSIQLIHISSNTITFTNGGTLVLDNENMKKVYNKLEDN